eukprot:6246771-Amphidinium_carterae.1
MPLLARGGSLNPLPQMTCVLPDEPRPWRTSRGLLLSTCMSGEGGRRFDSTLGFPDEGPQRCKGASKLILGPVKE